MNPRCLRPAEADSWARFPIAFGVKPQSGKRLREFGWRLGCGEGLAKFVKRHLRRRLSKLYARRGMKRKVLGSTLDKRSIVAQRKRLVHD